MFLCEEHRDWLWPLVLWWESCRYCLPCLASSSPLPLVVIWIITSTPAKPSSIFDTHKFSVNKRPSYHSQRDSTNPKSIDLRSFSTIKSTRIGFPNSRGYQGQRLATLISFYLHKELCLETSGDCAQSCCDPTYYDQ